MAKSYYSTVFEQSADEVWRIIRDFNNYPVWVDGAGTSEIEEGRAGDAVGAIRNVLYKGMRRRQRLLALSDAERTQTYEFAGEIAAAGAEFPGDHPRHAHRRRRPRFRRMVGERSIASRLCARSGSRFSATRSRGWLESLRRHLQRDVAIAQRA